MLFYMGYQYIFMNLEIFKKVISILEKQKKSWKQPAVGVILQSGVEDKAYAALVSTLISLRTKDAVTEAASFRLFSKAKNWKGLFDLDEKEISKLIYPAGFYKTKASQLKKIASIVLNQHEGKIPASLEELIKLPGVGRKTANLVLIEGFGLAEGLCVDVHVHRITNRWGLIQTKTPDETEMKLREILPKKYWKGLNELLVAFGQNVCVPVSPWCSRCQIAKLCPRKNVERSR